MKKTICILPHKLGLGGPASFQSRLIKVLNEKGYSVTFDALDPANSVILVIGGTKEIRSLKQAKKNGVRIVQRLNGMNWIHRKTHTGMRHFIRAEVNNRILSTIRGMADQIVYQSEFTKKWWTQTYGETKNIGAVIYNGVDLDEFSPQGEGTPPNDHYRILMVEGHLGGGYEQGLESAVKMTQLLNSRVDKPVELMVVGDVQDEVRKAYDASGVDIVWRGVVKREAIPAIDRAAHVLFSSDVNAACPNSVIEAMACGLPVVGYDTGALPELVTHSSGAVARYVSDVWKLEKPDVHTLADAAQEVLLNQDKYRLGARQRAIDEFNIQRIVDRYLQVLF